MVLLIEDSSIAGLKKSDKQLYSLIEDLLKALKTIVNPTTPEGNVSNNDTEKNNRNDNLPVANITSSYIEEATTKFSDIKVSRQNILKILEEESLDGVIARTEEPLIKQIYMLENELEKIIGKPQTIT